MPVSVGFNHVATLTTDLDRLVGFYRDAFGAVLTFEMAAAGDHPRMAILDLGGGGALNVFEVGPEAMLGDQRRIGGRGAIDHFAIAVDSLETLHTMSGRVVAAGGEVGEVQRLGDGWSLFFRDPDGMELEICTPGP